MRLAFRTMVAEQVKNVGFSNTIKEIRAYLLWQDVLGQNVKLPEGLG